MLCDVHPVNNLRKLCKRRQRHIKMYLDQIRSVLSRVCAACAFVLAGLSELPLNATWKGLSVSAWFGHETSL